ncbi:MAG TPA: sigma-70 family RNA polymerase sigma factor [Terriglobia bacterium]|nr:sigma-70 family RNA polymerase sigma factor [Terriglobia bacterium]
MTNAEKPQINVQALVRRAQTGDFAAFEMLTDLYEDKVYSFALRMLRHQEDAEDVTQQTFQSALENLAEFRWKASFSAWLIRLATHATLKVIHKRKGLHTVSLEEATERTNDWEAVTHPEYIADWRESPKERVHSNQEKQLLNDALAQLDEKHRLVFLLRDVEGFSVKETAVTLGLTAANTEVRLLRARLQLREQLTRTFGNPDSRKTKLPIKSFPDSVFTPRLLLQ